MENNSTTYLTSPINQPSPEISPIWIALISKEINSLQGRPAEFPRLFMHIYDLHLEVTFLF
jgi:hypothetical protein